MVPLNDWPLWAFRRRAARRRPEYPEPAERDRILNLIREHGPLTQRELRQPGDRASNGWAWGPAKRAAEFMLWAGDLICVRRTPRWERLLDLPERHLPPHTCTPRRRPTTNASPPCSPTPAAPSASPPPATSPTTSESPPAPPRGSSHTAPCSQPPSLAGPRQPGHIPTS
ncbi:DNA glycosylase AlkZ-like family protein [Streptomyces sp. NPDC048211]|uniref:DNA glycosylase AlkZ-like family protein n=1 Tax=Streptomyces sp. NPDC048211 TaxID=3365516 RepID=UPI00371B6F6F